MFLFYFRSSGQFLQNIERHTYFGIRRTERYLRFLPFYKNPIERSKINEDPISPSNTEGGHYMFF